MSKKTDYTNIRIRRDTRKLIGQCQEVVAAARARMRQWMLAATDEQLKQAWPGTAPEDVRQAARTMPATPDVATVMAEICRYWLHHREIMAADPGGEIATFGVAKLHQLVAVAIRAMLSLDPAAPKLADLEIPLGPDATGYIELEGSDGDRRRILWGKNALEPTADDLLAVHPQPSEDHPPA